LRKDKNRKREIGFYLTNQSGETVSEKELKRQFRRLAALIREGWTAHEVINLREYGVIVTLKNKALYEKTHRKK
jgi:hypothetical protein